MRDSGVAVAIGTVVAAVGIGCYFGKGKLIGRLPGLSEKQNSLVLAGFGLFFVALGLVHLL